MTSEHPLFVVDTCKMGGNWERYDGHCILAGCVHGLQQHVLWPRLIWSTVYSLNVCHNPSFPMLLICFTKSRDDWLLWQRVRADSVTSLCRQPPNTVLCSSNINRRIDAIHGVMESLETSRSGDVYVVEKRGSIYVEGRVWDDAGRFAETKKSEEEEEKYKEMQWKSDEREECVFNHSSDINCLIMWWLITYIFTLTLV